MGVANPEFSGTGAGGCRGFDPGHIDRRDADLRVLLRVAVVANVALAAAELANFELGGFDRVIDDFGLNRSPCDQGTADLASRIGAGGQHAVKLERIAHLGPVAEIDLEPVSSRNAVLMT